jgi:hypothetical protein
MMTMTCGRTGAGAGAAACTGAVLMLGRGRGRGRVVVAVGRVVAAGEAAVTVDDVAPVVGDVELPVVLPGLVDDDDEVALSARTTGTSTARVGPTGERDMYRPPANPVNPTSTTSVIGTATRAGLRWRPWRGPR